jgi:hypothetical protein
MVFLLNCVFSFFSSTFNAPNIRYDSESWNFLEYNRGLTLCQQGQGIESSDHLHHIAIAPNLSPNVNRVGLKHKKRNLERFWSLWVLLCPNRQREGTVADLLHHPTHVPDGKRKYEYVLVQSLAWSGERLLSVTLHHTHLIKSNDDNTGDHVRTTTRCVIFPRCLFRFNFIVAERLKLMLVVL